MTLPVALPDRAPPLLSCPPPGGLQPAAFFGLDTLIPGSSLYLMAQGLQRRQLVGRAELLGLAWRRMGPGSMAGGRSKVRTASAAALSFVAGRRRPEVVALAREIADERILPVVYPDLTELIDAFRAAGVLTFVVTAAPTELAGIVATRLGMTGALGTTAEIGDDERYSGRLDGAVLRGMAKAGAVQAYSEAFGIDLFSSVAYSNSIIDLPLLELVGRAEVINPDRQLRRVARLRGWAVHDVRPAGPRPVPHRLAALELASPLAVEGKPRRRGAIHRFTTEDPPALVRALEESGNFRRDTRLGSIFHRGKVSMRELSPTHSLHITMKNNRVWAHVDRYSPLAISQPAKAARYALHRVAVHNLTGMAADLARLVPGRRRRYCRPRPASENQ